MAVEKTVLIVEARYYDAIVDDLLTGAAAVLEDEGLAYERLTVPGAFEVPAAIAYALDAVAAGGRAAYAGYLTLGCVIRGETDHYDYICSAVSAALMDLSVRRGAAIGFGILTCPTYEHARVRADPDGKNKGAEAAHACARMVALRQGFGVLR